MKKQKDLSTRFRSAEKQLKVQPSDHAWNRLEARLDTVPKQNTGRVVQLRLLALAASLVLLVGAFYFFQNDQPSGFANDPFRPTILETLTGAEDCNPYCAVMKARKELPDDYVRTVRWKN